MTLYGIAEIAAALGVTPGLVSQWRKRGKLPEPSAELAMGPVWTGDRIEFWIRSKPRPKQPQAPAVSRPIADRSP